MAAYLGYTLRLRASHGIVTGSSWACHGLVMGLSRASHGIVTGLSRDCHGIVMGLSRASHGIVTGLSRLVMEFHGLVTG